MAHIDDAVTPELSVDIGVDSSGFPVVLLTGELDLSNVGLLQGALRPLLSSRPERLTFDLNALRFIDSTGIAVMVEAAQVAGTVLLGHPSTLIRRVIESTGLSQILRIADG